MSARLSYDNQRGARAVAAAERRARVLGRARAEQLAKAAAALEELRVAEIHAKHRAALRTGGISIWETELMMLDVDRFDDLWARRATLPAWQREGLELERARRLSGGAGGGAHG